jgi:uncharacterized membrane protein YczE
MRIFTIKTVPTVGWSSSHPHNIRPNPTTLFWLALGLFLFGAGETLLIAACIGVSPWTVLAQGIAVSFNIGIGAATFVVSLAVLLLWLPLRQCPGIGTVCNVLIISATIGFLLPYVPAPENYWARILEVGLGTLIVGLGSGIYLVANLGAGPRDGLMTGLQSLTKFPIAWVRASIEITTILCGWMLGGTVGIGTVMFAIGIGPAVSAGLYLTAYCTGAPVRSKTAATNRE